MRIILESETPDDRQKAVVIETLRELIELIEKKEIRNFTLIDDDNFGEQACTHFSSFFGEAPQKYVVQKGHGRITIEFEYGE